VDKRFADIKLTETKGNFGVPKAMVCFSDVGIGPNQGNESCGNKEYAAGSFFSEKPLEGSNNLVGNQMPGGCHVLVTV
jgi:hypothetical protein